MDEFVMLDVSRDLQCGDAAHDGLIHVYLQCQLKFLGPRKTGFALQAAAGNGWSRVRLGLFSRSADRHR
jgi:hypothetical protein